MSLGTILLVILILILIGALPNWGYSSGWGYGPSGAVGVIVVILLILVLMGRVECASPWRRRLLRREPPTGSRVDPASNPARRPAMKGVLAWVIGIPIPIIIILYLLDVF